MTLRKKTLIIIGVTIVSLILILYATSRIILLSSFADLEEQHTRQNVERARSALFDDLSALDAVVFDWAAWDDTYVFIEDANEAYIHSNLVDQTFTGLRLNFMLFVNSSGQIVFGKGFDLHNEEEIPVPQSLQEHLTEDIPLLHHPDTESSVTGIVLLPEGPMLVASRPILTSEEEGPIRGALIMGRYLDSAEIERLAETTHLSLTVHWFDDSPMPADFQAARSSLSEEEPLVVQPLSEESIAGYALLKDIYGQPGLVLRADMPREIYKQGQASISYFVLSLLGVGLTFGVVILLLLERQVLTQLARLSKSVSSIGVSGNHSARVTMVGRDELSSLAGAINGMLEAMEQSEEALRESEERYRLLFNSGNDAVFVHGLTKDDMPGKFIEVNDVACQRLGYTREALLKLSPADIDAPEKTGDVPRIMKEFLTERHILFEMTHVARDGRKIPVEINAHLFDLKGQPTVLSIARDITERKRAERELEEAHEFLQSIIDGVAEPIMVIDTDHRVKLMNRVARESSPGEAVATEPLLCHQISHQRQTPCDGVHHPCPLEQVRESGRPVTVVHEHHRQNGGRRYLEILASPLWAADGAFQGIIESMRDVTERKRAEEERERLVAALQRRSTQLQTAAEVSKAANTILDPDELMSQTVNLIQERFNFYYVGLFLVDEAGKYAVLQASTGEAGRRMLEAGHKLAVGGPSMIGWCTAHGQARIALDVRKEAIRFDNPLLSQTRSEMALPLISHGQWCIGALTVQSTEEAAFSKDDIAALQAMADGVAVAIENAQLYQRLQRYAAELEEHVAERTAELAAVNEELKSFAYSVSHDLRAPLRSIAGFSRALLEDYAGRLNAEGQDYLRRVHAATQRMGQLIDDLLTLSRVTRAGMRRETVDLSQIARTIAEELQNTQPERQVEFAIAEGLVARGDAHLLRVVLENLLGNAWKFTSKQPRATVEFGVAQHDGEQAYFVRDDGAGFDVAYAGKLFGAFQRLHSTAEFEGTGIGLATVQRIIRRHGGRVWAEGVVGQGATFHFTLPASKRR